MNQSCLERAVARATGESRRTIRQHGFNLILDEILPETSPYLGLDCPGCGSEVVVAATGSALPEFAECRCCDLAYPYRSKELYLCADPESALRVLA